MKLYSSNKYYKLYNGKMQDMLEVIEPNSIDSVITDPPYGLTSITKRFGNENASETKYYKDGNYQRLAKGFMGKTWDGTGIELDPNAWRKCYEVLKPGGYLLAFGGSRTFHRIACAIEDAGFEIRDTIMWLYGSGFPKSLNIGLAVDKKKGIDNKTGKICNNGKSTCSGSNIYNCNDSTQKKLEPIYEERIAQNEWSGWGTALKPAFEPIIVARKPFKGSVVSNIQKYKVGGINIDECRSNEGNRFPSNIILDSTEGEDWRRYFYCAKACKKDREEGLENFEVQKVNDGRLTSIDNPFQRGDSLRHNTHPTVKPTELMQYLIRLVSPKGATILDCFNGSGSTGKAVMLENVERDSNYKYIGIEMTDEYLPIAKARIEYVLNIHNSVQLSMFD